MNIFAPLSLLASLCLLALLSQCSHYASAIDDNELALFQTASCKGDVKTVKKLLKGAKPGDHVRMFSFFESDGLTSLQCAVKNGHLKVVSVLLKKEWYNEGFTVTRNIAFETGTGLNAVLCAIPGKHKILKMLLDSLDNDGILTSPNKVDQITPLMLASAQGSSKDVKLLLERLPLSVQVKAQTDDGSTALLYAIKAGSVDVVKLLLDVDRDNGAAQQSQSFNLTEFGSPFIHACLGENPAIISELLKVPSLYRDILIDDKEFKRLQRSFRESSSSQVDQLSRIIEVIDLWVRLRCEYATRLDSTVKDFSGDGEIPSKLVFTKATISKFLGQLKSNH